MLNKLRLNPSDIFSNDFQSKELRHTVVQGGMSQVLGGVMSFGISIVNTIILARLLTPADFGIIGMVAVFINFLSMFKNAGLSTATVQKKKISNEQISTLFWINVLISIGLGMIIFLSSPLVAMFYKKPELTGVTAVLSVVFIMRGITIQHNALLQRHLKFTALAIKEIIALLCSMIVAIVMAYFGFRYWALVGGSIARTIVLIILAFFFCPWIPGKMQKGTGVREMLKFGGHLTGSNLVGFFSRNLDKILIGKFIGAEPLGLYSKSFQFLMRPMSQIRGPLTNISLPVLSSLINEPLRYQSYFRQLLDISISLTLPISVYAFLEGEFLIRILLGNQWMGAVPVFKILSVAAVFIAMSGFPGTVMLSFGFSKRYMYLTLISAIITSVSFIIGVYFGINGVATAYATASFLIMIPLVVFGFKGTYIKPILVLKAISGPLFSASVAGIIIYIILFFNLQETIIKHILIGFLFFAIYISLTLLRPKTRLTFRAILESIILKK